jgi:hypothetical protein
VLRVLPGGEDLFWFALASEEEAGYRFGIWGRTTPTQRAYVATLTGTGYARRRLAAALVASPEPLSVGA